MGAETMLLESEILSWAPLVLKADPTPVPKSTPPVNTQDWPAKMEGDLVWGPTDFASEDDFTITLNDAEVSEVESALKHFDGLKLLGSAVTRENFPLRTLGPKLEKATVDLHHGKGFFAVRGLSPCEYTAEENAIMFQGIASYVAAKKGRQNNKGELLVHIRDAKLNKTPQDERPTRYSKRASTFHSDTFCDILALQTRKNAVIGGSNFLASSWTIYNKLQERHPDLVHLLAQPNWGFDSRGEFLPSSSRPILYYHDGRVIINFAREPLLGVKGDSGEDRMVGLPYLTGEQRDALDLLEDLAKESQIKLKAEPGDILFVNNHGVLHSREAFEDTPESPRYLVRMWLKNEDLAWKLPESLANNNTRIYGNNELGTSWNFNEEMKSGEFPITERLTS